MKHTLLTFLSGDAYYTEQRWIDDWMMLATRYAGNPTIIGADLFNEPKRTATWGTTMPLTDWKPLAKPIVTGAFLPQLSSLGPELARFCNWFLRKSI